MPPAMIEPLKVGTVPEVYTMPFDVHAPLAETQLARNQEKKYSDHT